METICTPQPDRFVFSRKHPHLVEMYKAHLRLFWTVEEIDMANDQKDWDVLPESERTFVKNILAFFAFSDGVVMENLTDNFLSEVKLTEAVNFYKVQNMMESIHSETYEMMLQTFCDDQDEVQKYVRAMDEFAPLRKKAEWMFQYMDKDAKSFAERLVAFVCVEGIMFSGSFAAIFWLKQRGILPGLTFSNELISRDEALHTQFACALYKLVDHPLSQGAVHEIVRSAVEVECAFLCESLPCDLIGMNKASLQQYIQFVADFLVRGLKNPLVDEYAPVYGATNPFVWMDLISMHGKTNFFEKRVSEYSKSATRSHTFELTEIF